VLNTGAKINPNGNERGSDSYRNWKHVTPEVDAEAELNTARSKAYAALKRINADRLTLDQANAVIALLETIK
jgi:hypothetical protein